ncbi:MAG: hypothetical protein QOJ08_2246, partial [Ilumatobacteraceae bacterium]
MLFVDLVLFVGRGEHMATVLVSH